MAIDRPTIVDDSGSGADGTIADAAWVDYLCDRIDAAIDGADASVRSVALGGTGAATLTGILKGNGTGAVTAHSLAAHGVVIGNGTGTPAVTGAGTAGQVFTSNGASADPTFQDATGTVDPGVCEGRLTLTSGTPVTTADVTGATSIYWTPYKGKYVALYSGSAWVLRAFAETTLALGTLVNAHGYDVFAYDNSGTLALEALEWKNATITMTIAAPGVVTWTAHGMATGNSITFTNSGGALPTGVTANTQYWITVVDANTFKLSTSPANVAAATFITTSGSQSGTHTGHQPQARNTALTLQDGVLVKTGATTRRYLGAFFTTATTTTEDSEAKRFLDNYYNREARSLYRRDTTATWTYTTQTWHQANSAAANQVERFTGYAEGVIELQFRTVVSNGTPTNVGISIAENSTNTPLDRSGIFQQANPEARMIACMIAKVVVLGYAYYAALEISVAGGTTTWYGNSGFSPASYLWHLNGTVKG